VAAFVLFAGIASPARAITISIDSITKLPGNTTSSGSYSSGANRSSGFDSAVSVPNPGGTKADTVGASVNAQTRYAWTQSSDSDAAAFGSEIFTGTSYYEVKFTVSPGSLSTVYDVKIDTARIGALVVRNEGGAAGEAESGAIVGTLNGIGQPSLGLAATGNLNTNSTAVVPVSQGNTLTLSGLSGTQSYTLQFLWTNRTASGNNVLSGGDEGVTLFGLDTRLNSRVAAADDYPGTSGRTNPAGDGHFVTITATVTVIPEPSTLAMATIAGLGMALFGWRRRMA
jgi:hypothetical protein